MEENFDESWKAIDSIYEDVKKIVDTNESLYIMPKGVYNAILSKMSHLEDKLKRQTTILKRHLKEKEELKKKLIDNKNETNPFMGEEEYPVKK